MKLTLILILLNVCVAFSSTYSQQTKFTLSGQNVSIRDVLSNVESKSEFRFFFNSELVNLNQRVNYNIEEGTISQLLDQVLLRNGIQYEVKDRTIILSPKPSNEPGIAAQQQRSVSGKVTDESGALLPGVSVVIKGSTQGTITDTNGNYSLPNVRTDATLVFSFVGMKSQEISADGKAIVNIKMEEETVGIEEVVAIGYGTMKKSDLTGSISSVPMDLLKNQPMVGLADILQGRVAGMTLTRTSGDPSAETKMRIRGPNSILGGNAPLTVVDGVVDASIGSVYDIESIEILKDASATAIYGESASNGVILITTKKATSGMPKIRISLNTSLRTQDTDYPGIMNAAEYAEFMNEFRGAGTFSAAEIENFKKDGGTDWPASIMRTGIQNHHHITYSQKTNKLGVYLSGSYNKEKGVIGNQQIGANYYLRSRVTFEPTKRLSFNLDIKASKNQSSNGILYAEGEKSHPLFQSLIWSPTEPIWIDKENKIYNERDHYGALEINPYMNVMEQNTFLKSNSVSSILEANYQITDWLTYHVTGMASTSNSHSGGYSNKWLNKNDPQASRSSSTSFNWRLINRIEFNKTFNNAHNLRVAGVYEADANESWSLGGSGRHMPLPDLARYYSIHMSNLQSARSGFGESSSIAYLGRLNYHYKSRYYFTTSYRVDAQSGPTDRPERNKYGGFPSFAVSWRASEEPFMKDGFFDNLKLRLGWGLTGNPSGFPYTAMAVRYFNYGQGTDAIGYTPGIPTNPNLKWEETAQTDIGIDLTILDEKLSLALDYFSKKTTDLLTQQPLPGYYGYGGGVSYTQNLGQINNKGFELTLDFTPIQTSNFYWGLNFNLSSVRNKVINLGDQAAFMTGTRATGFLDVETYRVQEGLALGTMWGYKFLGIWRTDEASEAAKYAEQPGDLKFEDVNKDGAINLADDGQKIGDANPDFTWGLSSAITYKNFDLNILLQGMHGQDVYNLVRAAMSTVHPDSRTITLREPAFNYWTPENQDTQWPNIHSTSSKKRLNSSQWIENGSWVKVKYVGLTYHIPRSIISFGDLSLSVSGTDLLTFTKYKGYDPEVSASGAADVWGGCDFGTFPIPKTITFSVALDF